MQKNSSISSFDKLSKRYFLMLVGGFYGTFLLSVTLFYFKPEYFYWRPWEFFGEIVYNTPGCNRVWVGKEKGDFSRKLLFTKQNKWPTKVSCDFEGFRSVPYQAETYPILVVGDSHIWGSGLSDHETLAWQLAEKLNIPTFYGGRGYKMLDFLVSKDSLKNTKLILELVQSSMLCEKNFNIAFNEDFIPQTYKPLTPEKASIKQAFIPQRYFLPFKFFRPLSISVLLQTAKTLRDEFLKPHKRYVSGKNGKDLQLVVERISKRSKQIAALGYQYVFIPIPMHNSVTHDEIDPVSLEWEVELIRQLKANHVHTVDLLSLFLVHRNEELYFPTDSHWNAKGVELALSEIIPYLEKNSLIPKE